jgi:hypothetical protein
VTSSAAAAITARASPSRHRRVPHIAAERVMSHLVIDALRL